VLSPSAEGFTFEQAAEAFAPCIAGLPIVLVGGQALNYWVDRYRSKCAALARDWPYTSVDVDFLAAPGVAAEVAERFGVQARILTARDQSVLCAIVHLTLPSGAGLRIDLLRKLQGLKENEIRKTALGAVDGGVKYLIMHPVLCMFSRVHNVIGLPKHYDNPHGLKQLKGSIHCAREFIQELLQRGQMKNARALAERIFRFARTSPARRALALHDVDVFSSVVVHPEYGDLFRERRYPQMKTQIDFLQQRAREHRARAIAAAAR
jgi:hypothetical protein